MCGAYGSGVTVRVVRVWFVASLCFASGKSDTEFTILPNHMIYNLGGG